MVYLIDDLFIRSLHLRSKEVAKVTIDVAKKIIPSFNPVPILILQFLHEVPLFPSRGKAMKTGRVPFATFHPISPTSLDPLDFIMLVYILNL
jgi:hypothetical protein